MRVTEKAPTPSNNVEKSARSKAASGRAAPLQRLPAPLPLPPTSESGIATQKLQFAAAFGNLQRDSAVKPWQPGSEDPQTIHQAAEHGTKGTGGPLPFLQQIQSSFGRFDVRNVQAYTDQRATEASRAMGALAYTTGNKVAFAGAPSLHTAAHEAAHTVQQRAGVQLQGGVGKLGDPYEQHADSVADAVVAGRSAESILATAPSGSANGSANGHGVQRKLTIGQSKANDKVQDQKNIKSIDAASVQAVKDWLTLYDLALPNGGEAIVKELLADGSVLDFVDKPEYFVERLTQAAEIYSAIPEGVPDEVSFANRGLKGSAQPLFRPSAKNLMDASSDKWLKVKFQYGFGGKQKGFAANALGYNYKKAKADANKGRRLICATSATAIVSGFVNNPDDIENILDKSKVMAGKLNADKKQPNAMSADQAQAVARTFASQTGVLVSNVYQVSKVSNKQKYRDKLKDMATYAAEQLAEIVQGMQVGERIYVGLDQFKGVTPLDDNSTEIKYDKGHAIAGVKLQNGMKWFESNNPGAPNLGPRAMVGPEAGNQFKYFITKPDPNFDPLEEANEEVANEADNENDEVDNEEE